MQATPHNFVKALKAAGSERAATVIAIIAAFGFIYYFFDVVMMCFGAILIAVVLQVVAAPFKKLKLQNWAALIISAVILVGIVGVTAYLFGTRLATDLQDILARMASAQSSIRASLESSPTGKLIVSHLSSANLPLGQIATSIFSLSSNLIAGVVVAVMGGLYLAAQPSLYLNGFLTLFPRNARDHAEETAIAIGNALYLWLAGQFITMILIGILFGVSAWLIGLSNPFALGLIAGVLEFIPYVGPVLAAIPALLVAATQGFNSVIWTFVAYICIHLVEGNVIAPLIQREMVYIPPAVMLLGIAAISFIFGSYAIIFAAPLCVVIFVLVKKLYVRDSLKEATPLPGEDHPAITKD